jgi:hypothetical protein
MGSSQEFSTSLLSGPGGKRRKGRLDDESRNAFYAAAAALIPADFMDKRMGRSLETGKTHQYSQKDAPKSCCNQKGGFSRGSGLQAGNAAVDAVWLDCVDTENMRYQYVGGEARDDQIQQLHLDMFVGIPSLRPWAHSDNRGLAGGGVLFSMSDQCHREILEHM